MKARPSARGPVAVAAVLLAAGRGERLGARVNKLYLKLGDRPILAHSLLRLVRSSRIDRLVVVIRPGEEELFQREIHERFDLSRLKAKIELVPGGQERQDSARAGIEALAATGAEPELVLIHDAARPFFSEGLVERLLQAAHEHGAAIPALPAKETMRLTDEAGFAAGELDRGRLYRIQTPQCFRYRLLRQALAIAAERREYFTDDAGAVAAFTRTKIKIVPGEETNIKITTPLDLKLAELLLEELKEAEF